MKPYYEHAGITIYHGDCRDVMADGAADCVIADPPYGLRPINGTGYGRARIRIAGVLGLSVLIMAAWVAVEARRESVH